MQLNFKWFEAIELLRTSVIGERKKERETVAAHICDQVLFLSL